MSVLSRRARFPQSIMVESKRVADLMKSVVSILPNDSEGPSYRFRQSLRTDSLVNPIELILVSPCTKCVRSVSDSQMRKPQPLSRSGTVTHFCQ